MQTTFPRERDGAHFVLRQWFDSDFGHAAAKQLIMQDVNEINDLEKNEEVSHSVSFRGFLPRTSPRRGLARPDANQIS